MKLSQKITVFYIRTYLQFLALLSPERAAHKAIAIFCTPRRKYQHTPSAISQKAELLSFKLDQLTIRGYRWNYPSQKKILIIHGFNSAASNFEGYVAPLINRGYEVIAFDGPGHGRSDGDELFLPVYINTLREIVNQYGPFNSFIAHSFGGLAITHLLETIPLDNQTKLVLIAPATETISAINHFFQFVRLRKKSRYFFNRVITRQSGSTPDFFSIRRAVHNINAQILWLHDIQDDITPYADAEKVKNDNHEHIKFIISSGLGHRKIYRDKQTLNHILDFI